MERHEGPAQCHARPQTSAPYQLRSEAAEISSTSLLNEGQIYGNTVKQYRLRWDGANFIRWSVGRARYGGVIGVTVVDVYVIF